MVDVFLSYSRQDRGAAQRVADALAAEGLVVWWDHDLIGGTDYRAEIRRKIHAAGKTVVLWSPSSVASAFVLDEAGEARKLGKLVPVTIATCDIPFGFGDLHTIDLPVRPLDVASIVAAIRNQPLAPARPIRRPSRRWLVAGGATAAALGVAGLGTWHLTRPGGGGRPPLANRTALVIGNGTYGSIPALPNAPGDASLIARALEARGFRVSEMLNADREAMLDAIRAFENALSYNGGIGLFFYAGHAAFVNGEDLMVPVDARVEDGLLVGALNLADIQKEVRSRTTRRATSVGAAVIYSASKGEMALDGPPGGHSPFARALVDALEMRDDELADTFRRVQLRLRTDPCGAAVARGLRIEPPDDLPGTNTPAEPSRPCDPATYRQTPYLEGSWSAPFYFNKPQHDPTTDMLKIVIFDSCRDNPYRWRMAARS